MPAKVKSYYIGGYQMQASGYTGVQLLHIKNREGTVHINE
jgi:hypothetical protein